jgi:predicted HAD superfamily phosphohydrolase YqeG
MVLDETLVVWDVELRTEALERLLYALMTHCMDQV